MCGNATEADVPTVESVTETFKSGAARVVYVCDPLMAMGLDVDERVPVMTVPSPQSIVATSDAAEPIAVVTVATCPVNATPGVKVEAVAVTVRSWTQSPAEHALFGPHLVESGSGTPAFMHGSVTHWNE